MACAHLLNLVGQFVAALALEAAVASSGSLGAD